MVPRRRVPNVRTKSGRKLGLGLGPHVRTKSALEEEKKSTKRPYQIRSKVRIRVRPTWCLEEEYQTSVPNQVES